MHGMAITYPPRMMYRLGIFFQLFFCQFLTTVWGNRHYVGSTIREENSRSPQCYFGHMVSKITNRVSHGLISCRNTAGCCVIVSAKMSGGTSSFAGLYNIL